jgi:hypothetical protein
MDGWMETCRVSCQNKFVKLVHLVGFIIKKNSLYEIMSEMEVSIKCLPKRTKSGSTNLLKFTNLNKLGTKHTIKPSKNTQCKLTAQSPRTPEYC